MFLGSCLSYFLYLKKPTFPGFELFQKSIIGFFFKSEIKFPFVLILLEQRWTWGPEYWKAGQGRDTILDSTFLSEWHAFFRVPSSWNDGFRSGMGNRCHSLTLGNEISYPIKILNRTGEASLVVSWLNRCRGPMRTAGKERPFHFHVLMYLGNWKEGKCALLQLPPQENYSF